MYFVVCLLLLATGDIPGVGVAPARAGLKKERAIATARAANININTRNNSSDNNNDSNNQKTMIITVMAARRE